MPPREQAVLQPLTDYQYVVSITLALPYSLDTFDEATEKVFKLAIASLVSFYFPALPHLLCTSLCTLRHRVCCARGGSVWPFATVHRSPMVARPGRSGLQGAASAVR